MLSCCLRHLNITTVKNVYSGIKRINLGPRSRHQSVRIYRIRAGLFWITNKPLSIFLNWILDETELEICILLKYPPLLWNINQIILKCDVNLQICRIPKDSWIIPVVHCAVKCLRQVRQIIDFKAKSHYSVSTKKREAKLSKTRKSLCYDEWMHVYNYSVLFWRKNAMIIFFHLCCNR